MWKYFTRLCTFCIYANTTENKICYSLFGGGGGGNGYDGFAACVTAASAAAATLSMYVYNV